MTSDLSEEFKKIETFIFDVDGVMTDGTIILTSAGDALRKMNIKDGYALQLAKKRGYNIAIISGGSSETVRKRFHGLGIYDVYLKAENKVEVYKEFKLTYDISDETTLYMGDDIPDYQVMNLMGLPCAPNNAAVEIKSIAKYISEFNGGEGCVRDVIEKVMRAQNKWFSTQLSQEENFNW